MKSKHIILHTKEGGKEQMINNAACSEAIGAPWLISLKKQAQICVEIKSNVLCFPTALHSTKEQPASLDGKVYLICSTSLWWIVQQQSNGKKKGCEFGCELRLWDSELRFDVCQQQPDCFCAERTNIHLWIVKNTFCQFLILQWTTTRDVPSPALCGHSLVDMLQQCRRPRAGPGSSRHHRWSSDRLFNSFQSTQSFGSI